MVRNSTKFVSYKDLKKVCAGLKAAYSANSGAVYIANVVESLNYRLCKVTKNRLAFCYENNVKRLTGETQHRQL